MNPSQQKIDYVNPYRHSHCSQTSSVTLTTLRHLTEQALKIPDAAGYAPITLENRDIWELK